MRSQRDLLDQASRWAACVERKLSPPERKTMSAKSGEAHGFGTIVASDERLSRAARKLHSRTLARAVALAAALSMAPAEMRAEQWVQRYSGPGADIDEAIAIVVDRNGDAIVTGRSYGGGSGMDYATIKYSSSGVPLWTNRYNGLRNGFETNGHDGATSMVIDGDNNIIVTGYSEGTSSVRPIYVENYVTIKYSSAGVPLWTNRYRGPFDYDGPTAVAVDASNNVIVTGASSETDFPFFRFVYATVKYSAAGVQLWSHRYTLTGFGDSASALAVDANGNVIVTGSGNNAAGYPDYVTIKYSPEGTPLWTNRYNGPANWSDSAKAVAVDSSNNVVVTGHSYFSPNYANADYLTIKYSAAGVPLWTNRYTGSVISNDFARALAIDPRGSVFVTGESHNGTNRDYVTVAYASSGLPLWTNRYNSLGTGEESAYAIAVNASNVVVTGSSAALLYSHAGVPLWVDDTEGTNLFNAVAIDAGGNIFVTGHSLGGLSDYITIKYSHVEPVKIDLRRNGNQLVLSWTNAAFALQCAPAVTGPFTNVMGATSPYTNRMLRAQEFFRLISGN